MRLWIQEHSTPRLDSARFSRYVKHARNHYRQFFGENGRWCFIHGRWALAGSDSEICALRDEIPILVDNGCAGDWSFPAGRRKCDPAIKKPFLVTPSEMVGTKPYDSSLGWRTLPDGNLGDRFLIWSSAQNAWWPSLDYFSKKVREEFTIDNVLGHLDLEAPRIDDTIYLKTHSHSMNPYYWKHKLSPAGWADPIFAVISRASKQAGVEFEPQTVRDFLREQFGIT